MLSNHFQQLHAILIDEASLVGSTTLYQIDKRLRQILHTPTLYFGNVDMIFLGDLYQAQPVRDSLIFENPKVKKNTVPYDFWNEKIKCYQLHTTIHQKNTCFVNVLNKMRLNQQSKKDIAYINDHCHRPPPLDPLFPYIFYRNKDVHNHNAKMLSLVDGGQITLSAIDEHGSIAKCFAFQKTRSLPSTIIVKRNMLVELYAGNYNTDDGLVNGVEVIFKRYTNTNNGLDIVWI
jgi:hypothetical protein